MENELKTIQSDIKDLEERLRILRQREESIKKKLSAPMHLLNKYLKINEGVFDFYIKVESITQHAAFPGVFVAEGPSILICKQLKGINYTIKSLDMLPLSTLYKIVDEKEFNKEFKNALKYIIGDERV